MNECMYVCMYVCTYMTFVLVIGAFWRREEPVVEEEPKAPLGVLAAAQNPASPSM